MTDLDAALMDDMNDVRRSADDAYYPMRAMRLGNDWLPHLDFWRREAAWARDFYSDAAFHNDGGLGASMRASLERWIERFGWAEYHLGKYIVHEGSYKD